MKVEVIEKRDGEVMVKFTAVSPIEAAGLAMVSLGPAPGAGTGFGIATRPWDHDKAFAQFSSFEMPVIAQMQPGPEDEKIPF